MVAVYLVAKGSAGCLPDWLPKHWLESARRHVSPKSEKIPTTKDELYKWVATCLNLTKSSVERICHELRVEYSHRSKCGNPKLSLKELCELIDSEGPLFDEFLRLRIRTEFR